jgi:hypothetical protein
VRILSVLVFVLASLVTLGPATAQTYDQATVEAHLREMYKDHGDRLFKWKGQIHYRVAGLESEATKRLVDDQFAYLRDLTGLDIQNAATTGRKGNFIFIFAGRYTGLADLKSVRAIFGDEGQSDAGYRSMLEELERDGRSRSITKSSADAIVFHALLTNPNSWKDELFTSLVLRFIAFGLTHTGTSEEIQLSMFNALAGLRPMARLPSIDEIYLRNLYRGDVRSATPTNQGIRHLAATITFDLNN